MSGVAYFLCEITFNFNLLKSSFFCRLQSKFHIVNIKISVFKHFKKLTLDISLGCFLCKKGNPRGLPLQLQV